MFERRHQPLVSRRVFVRRVANSTTVAFSLILAALGVGVLGYHALADLPWVDAILNASMILGGMGPVDPLHSSAAKLFAAWYALFSGLLFIAIAGILFAPIVHRIMHRFHLEAGADRGQ